VGFPVALLPSIASTKYSLLIRLVCNQALLLFAFRNSGPLSDVVANAAGDFSHSMRDGCGALRQSRVMGRAVIVSMRYNYNFSIFLHSRRLRVQPWPRCRVAFSWALLFIYSDTLLQRRAAPAAGHAHRTRSNVIAHLRRLGYAMRP